MVAVECIAIELCFNNSAEEEWVLAETTLGWEEGAQGRLLRSKVRGEAGLVPLRKCVQLSRLGVLVKVAQDEMSRLQSINWVQSPQNGDYEKLSRPVRVTHDGTS